MSSRDEASVATPCVEYVEAEKDRAMCRALMSTRTMREAETEYLPREVGEDVSDYSARLARTFLYPILEHTVSFLVGIAFRKDLAADPEDHPRVLEWRTNIDRRKTSLDVFSREVLRYMLREGSCAVFVGYPDMAPKNLHEERLHDVRPYFTLIPSESLIYWRREAGQLVEVRISESETIVSGWEESQREYVRRIVLDETGVVVSQKWVPEVVGSHTVWSQEGEDQVLGVSEIPVVAFPNFDASPPLLELAWLNVEHWQSSSDQKNILHIARVPFLFGAGLDEDEDEGAGSVEGGGGTFILSAGRLLSARNPDAKLTWVEHTGSSIESGASDLNNIEERALRLGMRAALQPHSSDITATEVVVQKQETDSLLRVVVSQFLADLAECFRVAGLWVGESIDVAFNLDASFDYLFGDPLRVVEVLLEFAKEIDAPPDFIIEQAKRVGFLPHGLDVDKLIASLGSFGEDEELDAASQGNIVFPVG